MGLLGPKIGSSNINTTGIRNGFQRGREGGDRPLNKIMDKLEEGALGSNVTQVGANRDWTGKGMLSIDIVGGAKFEFPSYFRTKPCNHHLCLEGSSHQKRLPNCPQQSQIVQKL